MPQEKINTITIIQALAEITAMKHQAQAGGNIDDEVYNFDEVIRKVSEGLITPQEGVAQAQNITNRRNER